jgi:hypothetical protein
MPYLLALIVLPGLWACAPARATTATHQEPLSQEIVLALRQSAPVGGTSLSITLEDVVDDSRCPKDVTCVWAGDVAVRVRIDGGKAPAHVATLHLNTREKETVYDDRRVTLVAVTPYPESTQKIDPAAYRATVRVRTIASP